MFDEIVFTDLPREEAQAQLEKYNKVNFSFFFQGFVFFK